MSEQKLPQNQSNAPSNDEAANSERLQRWLKRRDRLATIPLVDVLEAFGARQDRRDRNKWKIDGVGNILIKGQKWLNGNNNIPGYGAVRLAIHILGEEKDTKGMEWLAEKFPDVLGDDWVAPQQEEEEEKGFTPPVRNDDFAEQVRDYLIGRRGLPADLVDAEMKAGRIYATEHRSKDDETGQWSSDIRAVFIGPSSAELRSTDPNGFKGCCTGSDSERSGYQVMFRGQSDGRVGIVEAAIDALSYNALNPGRYCYSTNGAGRFHLQYRLTLEAWRNDFSTDLGLDADHAGDLGAQMVFNALYLRDYLSEKMEVQPEQIDEWLLTDRIQFSALESPHQMFFSLPSCENEKSRWQVYRREKNPNKKAPPEERTLLIKTDEVAPPTVSFTISKMTNGMKAGKYDVAIDLDTIEQIKAKYRVNRDRPVLGKDWNDVWKKVQLQASKKAEQKQDESAQASSANSEQGDDYQPTGRFVRRMR